MTLPDALAATPRLPMGDDGAPVFCTPWEARVFAMTLQVHQAGAFTWTEWSEALGAELAKDDDGNGIVVSYYEHWLAAFENLLEQKSVAGSGTLSVLKEAWAEAARTTPHGTPIELAGPEG